MSADLEPVVMLPVAKRPRIERLQWLCCLLCQSYEGSSKISNATDDGADKVKRSYKVRRDCGDVTATFKTFMDNIDSDIDCLVEKKAKWHKRCYASYTSRNNVERIEKRFEKTLCESRPTTPDQTSTYTTPITRKTVPSVDWKGCIFCQSRIKGKQLHRVETKLVEHAIQEIAKTNYKLKCKIGDNDLIAYEAHYHAYCKTKEERGDINSTDTGEPMSTAQKNAFASLISQLDEGLCKGHVYGMNDINDQYIHLLDQEGLSDPKSYSHRLKERLEVHYGAKITLRRMRDKTQPLLLFLSGSAGDAVEALKIATDNFKEESMDDSLTSLGQQSMLLRSMHNVATKIKADLKATKGHQGYDNLTDESAVACVPDSLYMLLKWIYSAESEEELIEALQDLDEDEDNDEDRESKVTRAEEKVHKKIINTGQTILYQFSNARKHTPKQISTGLFIHQASRNKNLVDYVHSIGESIRYETILKIDTSIANVEIDRFRRNGNVFVPANLVPGRFVQFSCDNFDIIEETLDGKGTFHVTQMAAFQRGPERNTVQVPTVIGNDRSLKNMPEEMTELVLANVPAKRPKPMFSKPVTSEWFKNTGVTDTSKYKTLDLLWLICRYHSHKPHQSTPGWTPFNQVISKNTSPKTTVGFIPIIPAPAHEMDTIMTFIIRCQKIAEKLENPYTVITLDQALYFRAMELVQHNRQQFRNVILRLGGFHAAMVHMAVIGQHFADSGLKDLWVESGLFTEVTCDKILSGKLWNRGVRAHKITMEAFSRVLFEQFEHWLEREGKSSFQDMVNDSHAIDVAFADKDYEEVPDAVNQILKNMPDLEKDFEEFLSSKADDPTFCYWKQYIDIVGVLLQYIRAERDGIWDLHLSTFRIMLQWQALYHHVNYQRSGLVYLIDMLELEDTAYPVYVEWKEGNFVVKETEGHFNQVYTDQALEHVNKLCKLDGGLVGITRQQAALFRWMIICCFRAHLTNNILKTSGCVKNDRMNLHKEILPARLQRDEGDVNILVSKIKVFNPFGRDNSDLVVISTNDVAPYDVKADLISAPEKGKQIIEQFIEDRLGPNASKGFYDVIKKPAHKTFASLYQVSVHTKAGKTTTVKADSKLRKRLFNAANSGRKVNVAELVKHELSPVPLSLANLDGTLLVADKPPLAHLLSDFCAQDTPPQPVANTCVIIDAMALINAHGNKSRKAKTFGDLAAAITKSVFDHFCDTCGRVDIIFDTYNVNSVKQGTRDVRARGSRKIRRIIDRPEIRLPDS